MGKLGKPRNNLVCHFPACFQSQCPTQQDGTPIRLDCVIVDVMQYAVGVIKYGDQALNSATVISVIQRMVSRYLESEQYVIETGLVLLLDNPEYVPALKSATQKTRDGSAPTRILDAELYEGLGDLGVNDHLIIDEYSRDVPLDRSTLWRSISTRLQLVRLMTHAIVFAQADNTRNQATVMLDDGVAIHPDVYCDQRSAMIDDLGFHARPPYAIESMVGAMMRHHMSEHIYVYPDGEIKRTPTRPVGEADIKVCLYIQRGGGPYLVVSQDTDSIFILLLHMKTVQAEDGSLPQVWLDTRRPQDEKKSDEASHCYRYIDVTRLYREILALFAVEYAEVRHPIETLVLLTYSLETDFTRAFHPYLEVQPHDVWDVFSELHSTNRAGFPLFESNINETTPIKPRRQTLRLMPRELRGLLNETVSVTYCAERDTYEIDLDELSLQRFYYLLCEQKVRRDLVAVGYKEFGAKHIVDTDQLFMRVAELEESVRLCREKGLAGIKEREAQSQKVFLAQFDETKRLLKESNQAPPVIKSRYGTTAVASQPQPKRESTVKWSDFDLDSVGDDAKPLLDKRIVTLSQREIPPRYGLEDAKEMLARIYQRRFMLNYHQNGWIDPRYALSFDERHETHPFRSKHGWRSEEIEQTDATIARGEFNSCYNAQRYNAEAGLGEIPFRVFTVKETSDVHNRRHAEYSFGRQYLR